MQLDLFRTKDEEFRNHEVKMLKSLLENVRRGLFARHNNIEKMVIDLEKKIQDQEKEIQRLKHIIHDNESIISIEKAIFGA